MKYKELTEIIRKRREQFDLTQQDLSDMSSVSVRTIRTIESGADSFSVDSLFAIANALGLEVKLEVKKLNQ